MKKILIFILLMILINLNESKDFISNKMHSLEVPTRIASDINVMMNEKIEKKERRQYIKLYYCFLFIINYFNLACLWRLCSWQTKKENQNQNYKKKIQNYKFMKQLKSKI